MRGAGLSGKFGTFGGARGGILLGRRMAVGAAYYGLRRRFNASIRDEAGNPMYLDMNYGGLTLGVSAGLWSRGEFQLNTLVGGGSACVAYVEGGYHGLPFGCIERVPTFVVEPGATLYFNVADWVRLGLEGGYRFAAGYRWDAPNHFRLSGGYFGLAVEFGWFKKPRR